MKRIPFLKFRVVELFDQKFAIRLEVDDIAVHFALQFVLFFSANSADEIHFSLINLQHWLLLWCLLLLNQSDLLVLQQLQNLIFSFVFLNQLFERITRKGQKRRERIARAFRAENRRLIRKKRLFSKAHSGFQFLNHGNLIPDAIIAAAVRPRRRSRSCNEQLNLSWQNQVQFRLFCRRKRQIFWKNDLIGHIVFFLHNMN